MTTPPMTTKIAGIAKYSFCHHGISQTGRQVFPVPGLGDGVGAKSDPLSGAEGGEVGLGDCPGAGIGVGPPTVCASSVGMGPLYILTLGAVGRFAFGAGVVRMRRS